MPHQFTEDEIHLVTLDNVLTWKVCCPQCGAWGFIDDDQFYGRVSLQCGNKGCTFHETHDLSAVQPDLDRD